MSGVYFGKGFEENVYLRTQFFIFQRIYKKKLMEDMYPYDLIIDGDGASDDKHWRVLRIHMLLGYAQALADLNANEDFYKKIESIYDFEGTLIVTWKTEPTEEEKTYICKGWNSVVTDYEGNDIIHEVN